MGQLASSSPCQCWGNFLLCSASHDPVHALEWGRLRYTDIYFTRVSSLSPASAGFVSVCFWRYSSVASASILAYYYELICTMSSLYMEVLLKALKRRCHLIPKSRWPSSSSTIRHVSCPRIPVCSHGACGRAPRFIQWSRRAAAMKSWGVYYADTPQTHRSALWQTTVTIFLLKARRHRRE